MRTTNIDSRRSSVIEASFMHRTDIEITYLSGDLQPGQRIGSRYRLVRALGGSAREPVWSAESAEGTPVVITLLDPAICDVPDLHDAVFAELRQAEALDNPHLVRLLEHGVHARTPFFVTEFVKGESLTQRLARRGVLSPFELERVFRQMALGVDALHTRGLVHRDLRPARVLFGSSPAADRLQLSFGIGRPACEALELAHEMTARGRSSRRTLGYSSPELILGGSVDHRADLWALAMIACECLTGRLPFARAFPGDGEQLVRICTEPAPAPSTLGNVVDGFDAWFARGVQLRPERRYSSAREMADALASTLRVSQRAS